MLTGIISQIFKTIKPATLAVASSPWSANLMQQAGKNAEAIAGGSWGAISVRTKVRCYFPRANETKRVKVHGYKARMATPAGRQVIMRRILKGRFVLTH